MSNRASGTVVIRNKLGLHARPAMLFVECASRFESAIRVRRKDHDEWVDAKSVMQLMLLAAAICAPYLEIARLSRLSQVDPLTGTVYMTEDSQPKAGFYRYLPRETGALARGGRLQMMVVDGGMDMRSSLPLGHSWPVGWVDIDDPERGFVEGERYGRGVVSQGIAAGGSAFIGLEGCIWDDDRLFFTSKLGGAASAGYVFEYDPRGETVKLIYESPGHRHFSGPDNLVVSPRGNLVVCEDRVSSDTAGQSLAGFSKDGGFHKFCMIDPRLEGVWHGHDLATTARTSEWAGTCFSSDGTWLFANIYSPGITVAITGPWESHWM